MTENLQGGDGQDHTNDPLDVASRLEIDMCHNDHPFEPGIDIDMAAEGRSPDVRWCNVCGDTRGGLVGPSYDRKVKMLIAQRDAVAAQLDAARKKWMKALDLNAANRNRANAAEAANAAAGSQALRDAADAIDANNGYVMSVSGLPFSAAHAAPWLRRRADSLAGLAGEPETTSSPLSYDELEAERDRLALDLLSAENRIELISKLCGLKMRKARKSHRCERCRWSIKPGDLYSESKTTPSNFYIPGHWNTWRAHLYCPENDYEASL